LVLLVIIAIGGISWFISNKFLRRAGGSTAFRISIIVQKDTTITLEKTANAKRPGVFGISGADGQAIVGPIITSDEKSVPRELTSLAGVISKGSQVAWNTTVYGGLFRDSLHLPIQDISIPGALGNSPAWY